MIEVQIPVKMLGLDYNMMQANLNALSSFLLQIWEMIVNMFQLLYRNICFSWKNRYAAYC